MGVGEMGQIIGEMGVGEIGVDEMGVGEMGVFLLEYADVVWDNCTQYEADELEKIQIEAARIVTGATRLVSLNLLYCETGWNTLSCRRNKHKIIMFHKIYTGLSPPYLSALLPSTVGANVSYNLRNPNNLHTVQCHSQLYYNSFLPSAIRTWNGLQEDTSLLNIN